MNNINLITIIFISTFSLAPAAQAVNTEIESIYFGREYRQGEVVLPLQGTGLFRYLGLFKAYVGAIYYDAETDEQELLDNRPKRLEIYYFYPIKGEYFGKATNRMIARNVDQETLARIRPQIDYHNSLYRDVQPGDRYALTYIPGRGTELALNGESLGIIEGEAFASALFAMWLGENPMDDAFKEQLLGSGDQR